MEAEERALERFFEKIMPEPNSGCWYWMGASNNQGYGGFRLYGKQITAHRASYQLFRGDIPEGLCVCHTCDEKICVNPEHLWLGTHQENLDDMVKKGRQKSGEDCSWATLTDKDVDEIRRLRLLGSTLNKIGQIYGTCESNVSKICLNQGRILKQEPKP